MLSEESSLLQENNAGLSRCGKMVIRRFKSRRCCPWSSKAALIILIWNLIVSFGISSFLDPGWWNTYFFQVLGVFTSSVFYGFSTFLYLFYPLAGLLADIRWGRHKTVVNSLRFVLCCLLLMVLLGGLMTIGFIPSMINPPDDPDKLNTTQVITTSILSIGLGIPIFLGFLLLLMHLVLM